MKNSSKKTTLLAFKFLASLAIVALLWLSVIKWIPILLEYIIHQSTCKDAETCSKHISDLGATGDLFGAVTSLFSGLALCAIAVTLWIDSNARRETLKPLVVATADEDFFTIDNPTLEPSPEATILLRPKLANLVQDAALNACVQAEIVANDQKAISNTFIYHQPLVHQVIAEISIKIPITGELLARTVTNLTAPKGKIKITLRTTYSNLEQVEWQTEVTYDAQLHLPTDKAKLTALHQKDPKTLDLWQGGAISLDCIIENGSWKHTKNPSR